MINIMEAQTLVEAELLKMSAGFDPENQIVISGIQIIARDIGWVFFYNTRAFAETRDPRFGMYGNAPIIVDKENGSLHYTGTALPIEDYIEEYLMKRASNLPRP